jgi:hypothetical protein
MMPDDQTPNQSEPATRALPPIPGAPPGARLTYHFNLTIKITYADGTPFYDGADAGTTYDQSGRGCAAINKVFAQAIERLADLGLLAAAAKGEAIPDELKAFLDGGR